jgi:hypothetical protein
MSRYDYAEAINIVGYYGSTQKKGKERESHGLNSLRGYKGIRTDEQASA